MVPCEHKSCRDAFMTNRGMRVHHARMHGYPLSPAPGVRIRKGRHHENKVVNLTSERIYEFLACREILAGQMGVAPESLSAQQVVSATMQTFLAYVDGGGTLNFAWNDNRTREC